MTLRDRSNLPSFGHNRNKNNLALSVLCKVSPRHHSELFRDEHGTDGTNNITDNADANPAPISPIYADIQGVMENHNDSEARNVMSEIMLRLLNESDMLRQRLMLYETEISVLKQQVATRRADNKQNWSSLVMALQSVGANTVVDLPASDHDNDDENYNTGINPTDAAKLVIQSLVSQVEALNAENDKLKVKNGQQRLQIEELQSESDAHCQKVAVLEKQFSKINKTRQKVVSNIMNRAGN